MIKFLTLFAFTVSMLYAQISVRKIDSDILDEASGLLISKKYPGVFWSHNDSGDKARLYAFDMKSLKLIKKIKVKKAKNRDWEDLSYHKGKIVIGDFGNNKNRRENLRIYTIDEPNPYTDKKVKVISKQKFIFSDQKSSIFRRKNFDCEAMYSFNNKLFLLSKHRADTNTTLYVLKGSKAKKITQYSLDDRVTSADSDGRYVVILTYRSLYLIEPKGDNIFDYPVKRKILEDVGQVEGVAIDGDMIYVISEDGKFYNLHVKDFK
jgi:outer membrane protein assembly factor BamB